MAKPELGMKRQCQNCGAKFFDFSKSPIICPKCGTVFQAVAISRASSRAAVAADEEAEPDVGNVELVSLDEVEAAEEKAAPAAEDEIEIEDDEAADETFLEEEESDPDDVSNLIDSDIEDDEEA